MSANINMRRIAVASTAIQPTMKHACDYALVRFADLLFQSLPRAWAIGLGERLCLLASTVIPKRRALVLDNLAQAFPEKCHQERARIAGAVWRNLGRTAVEFVRITDYVSGPVEQVVDVEGREHMHRAMAEAKGVILLSAHFTNWELTGAFVQREFGSMTAIARPIRNPYVDRWIHRKRSAGGMKIIPAQEAVKASLKCLRAKSVVGILVDQSLSLGALRAMFFGRPAATTTLPALLHLQTGAPILITYTLREGDRFRHIFQPVEFPSVTKKADRIAVYTQVINTHFEDLIRRYPENWFWIHNRWKA